MPFVFLQTFFADKCLFVTTILDAESHLLVVIRWGEVEVAVGATAEVKDSFPVVSSTPAQPHGNGHLTLIAHFVRQHDIFVVGNCH